MRRLILMRHAKSSWVNRALPDHERPLNPRGVAAARALGLWLHRNGQQVDQALVSSSLRTRQTYAGLGLMTNPIVMPTLYHAEPDEILQLLRHVAGNVGTLLVLGHNPGLSALARLLVRLPPPHARFADYPTGATLICDFDIPDWTGLRLGSGRVASFTVPRDLPTPP